MTKSNPNKGSKSKIKVKKKRHKLKGQYESLTPTYDIREYDGCYEEETEDEF